MRHSGRTILAALFAAFAVGVLVWALHARQAGSAPYAPAQHDADYWRRRAAQPDDGVRATAFRQLGRMQDKQSASVLTQAAKSDASGFVRAVATESLGDLRDPAHVPVLTAALSDKDPRVSDAAATALGKVATPEAQAALTAAINESDQHKTVMIVFTLPQFKNQQTEDTLLGLLRTRSSWVRWRTIVALGRVGTVRCVPKLKELAANPLAGTDYDPGPDKGMDFLGQQVGRMLTDAIEAASKRPPWPSAANNSGGAP